MGFKRGVFVSRIRRHSAIGLDKSLRSLGVDTVGSEGLTIHTLLNVRTIYRIPIRRRVMDNIRGSPSVRRGDQAVRLLTLASTGGSVLHIRDSVTLPRSDPGVKRLLCSCIRIHGQRIVYAKRRVRVRKRTCIGMLCDDPRKGVR